MLVFVEYGAQDVYVGTAEYYESFVREPFDKVPSLGLCSGDLYVEKSPHVRYHPD